MENALFANVKKLYDHELYECVIPAASLMNTLLQNDQNVATAEMKYQVMLYLSSANYIERNFRLASKQLESAIRMRKTLVRQKNTSTYLSAIESSYAQFADVELRYRLAICFKELAEPTLAISMMQTVPSKMRTPKMNMLLARLQHHVRSKTEAIAAYKEVLSECPLSLSSIESLLELGMEGSDVNSLVFNAGNVEWLSTWIKGQAQMFGYKHLEAAKTFQQLNDTTPFRQNEYLLIQIGKCLYYYGNFVQAEHYLGMAAMVNPLNMSALCPLAVAYELNGKNDTQHEKLLDQITNRPDLVRAPSADYWFLHAQQFYKEEKFERSLIFSERSLTIDPRHIENMLLRGKLFVALERHQEAIEAFRTSQSLAPYRFEIYKGLSHCYGSLKRHKDAQNICAMAVRNFRTSPRSYTMFGRTILFYSTHPKAKKSARKFVEKSLEIDNSYLPAVALMAEIYRYDGATKEAILLLKKQVIMYPHAKLYAMLGDLLSQEKELGKALHYYYLALSLDPNCVKALQSINALNKTARSITTSSHINITTTSTATANMTANSSSSSVSNSASTTSRHPEPPSSSMSSSSLPANQPSGTGIGNSGATMTTPCGTPNHEWLLDCEETSHQDDALEMSSSPPVPQEDASDTFSEPFWQDVDGEMAN
ncbi:uncharacterized protein Dwil_GK25583 [Drosophila willistoni]|uniref:Uncharacterized protein n=1 Tax=Drosophila willistoni TaxID=7260 RepID=B4NE63_DROWI|nr:anaphase-promoting complex subunit 7 [Drosophila willistoni]XP_046867417.1 anaphase-promoting complex subunit 7 [Drosophila willistoni]EDW82032.2 uncharacterized protein Dwil_GK25583 [Drosophila willistoni]